MTDIPIEHISAGEDRLRPVRIWLYVIACLVLAMVVVGGITRLTHSGLSITTWKPISGILPPLSDADWMREFEGYKQIPEFRIENPWMTLAEFKFIFWWEWSHRFLGRIIGIAFFVPFLVFLFQGRLGRRLAPSLAVIFLLGGLQGFIGWWMVSSGLSVRTDVSQFRLATHLGAACLLFVALIWVARSIVPGREKQYVPAGWRRAVIALGAMLYLQLIAGAFVAGTDAGFAYNTWPLIDGAFIPKGLGAMEPGWINIFENALTIQFDHRMLAYAIGILVLVLWLVGRRSPGYEGVHGWYPRIGYLVALQIVLGVTTLLLVVPIPFAIGHQALAFMLIGTVTAYVADMTRVRR